jgi:glycine/D-amino acid oxidase-like deaminating enzyme
MANTDRVLIVGGGIAGLATARALTAHGIECDVVERAAAWSHPGTGLYLPANAVRAPGRSPREPDWLTRTRSFSQRRSSRSDRSRSSKPDGGRVSSSSRRRRTGAIELATCPRWFARRHSGSQDSGSSGVTTKRCSSDRDPGSNRATMRQRLEPEPRNRMNTAISSPPSCISPPWKWFFTPEVAGSSPVAPVPVSPHRSYVCVPGLLSAEARRVPIVCRTVTPRQPQEAA